MAELTINTMGSYQSGSYPFPKDEIPISQKKRELGKEVL